MHKCANRVWSSGLVWLLLSVMVLLLDRGSKIWMMDALMPGESLPLLPFLNFTLAYNTGAAFSFLHNASGWQHFFLGGLAVGVTLIILVWLSRLPRRDWWHNIALTLILAGALGNAFDRVLYGHVVDFIDFHLGDWHFAIFNVADSAICIGAFMLILLWARRKDE